MCRVRTGGMTSWVGAVSSSCSPGLRGRQGGVRRESSRGRTMFVPGWMHQTQNGLTPGTGPGQGYRTRHPIFMGWGGHSDGHDCSPENSSRLRRTPPPDPRAGGAARTGACSGPAAVSRRSVPSTPGGGGSAPPGRSAPCAAPSFPYGLPVAGGTRGGCVMTRAKFVHGLEGPHRNRPRAAARRAPRGYRAPDPFSWGRVPRSGMAVRSAHGRGSARRTIRFPGIAHTYMRTNKIESRHK